LKLRYAIKIVIVANNGKPTPSPPLNATARLFGPVAVAYVINVDEEVDNKMGDEFCVLAVEVGLAFNNEVGNNLVPALGCNMRPVQWDRYHNTKFHHRTPRGLHNWTSLSSVSLAASRFRG
jgi:hypothetical protein